jgi:hypothetical protein
MLLKAFLSLIFSYLVSLRHPDFFGANRAKHIRQPAAWLPAEFGRQKFIAAAAPD